MIDKLKLAWETFHSRSFAVSLKKHHPEIYKWVQEQTISISAKTLSDKVFVLLNPYQPTCNNNGCENKVTTLSRNGWSSYCCLKCKGQHNSSKSREKAKATSIANWGVENPAQHLSVKDKIKNTMIDRYGVEFAKKSPLLRDKTKNTMVLKYGVEYAIQYPEFRDKIKKTCLEKYGVENAAQKDISVETFNKLNDVNWLIEKNKKSTMLSMSSELNISVVTLAKAFKKFNIEPAGHNKSTAEIEISNFIQEKLGNNRKLQLGTKKIIYPFEIDIFIEDINVAIEYNGGWYHSELNGKERDYHIGKTNLCLDKKIKLIHIWEHEYKNKKDIVLSKLNHICGKSTTVYARKCKLSEISLDTANQFLNTTHIQGSSISKHRLGLFNNNELVAVMTFGKTRFNKNYEWELLRYSSKLNHNIVGGFSKLLSCFIKTFNPQSIITYSDKAWSTGDVYKKNGFKFLNTIPPSYFYTKNYADFYNRINFQKKKLQTMLDTFDPKLTEWENMQNNGYDRIWNCGNDSWVWSV